MLSNAACSGTVLLHLTIATGSQSLGRAVEWPAEKHSDLGEISVDLDDLVVAVMEDLGVTRRKN